MTKTEYLILVSKINELDLESGKVLKANGQWYVDGKRSTVPAPIIKLPHWTEGTKRVIIDHHA